MVSLALLRRLRMTLEQQTRSLSMVARRPSYYSEMLFPTAFQSIHFTFGTRGFLINVRSSISSRPLFIVNWSNNVRRSAVLQPCVIIKYCHTKNCMYRYLLMRTSQPQGLMLNPSHSSLCPSVCYPPASNVRRQYSDALLPIPPLTFSTVLLYRVAV